MIRLPGMVLWIVGALLLCGFNASVRPQMVDGCRYVVLEDAARAHDYRVTYAPDGKSVTVSGSRFSICFFPNSAVARLEKVRFALAGKVLRRPDGVWLIRDDDWRDTLIPLLAAMPLPPTPIRRVVIDAGHGGHDPGAVRDGVEEKKVNLKLAERLVPLREERNFKVVLTRSGDTALPLDARADRVRLENGDIFLSIHQNAAVNPEATGIEIFYAPSNRYAAASMQLAQAVLFCILLRNDGLGTAMDRGVKRAGFRVLRKADCPAVLLECGFLSNVRDRGQLTQDAYLDQLAESVAVGLEAYRSLLHPYVPEKKVPEKKEEENNAF